MKIAQSTIQLARSRAAATYLKRQEVLTVGKQGGGNGSH